MRVAIAIAIELTADGRNYAHEVGPRTQYARRLVQVVRIVLSADGGRENQDLARELGKPCHS